MEIKDLQARQGHVELIADVVEKTEPRTFEKFGKQGRVCKAKVKDATGTVTLTLWNEDIEKINVGDKIKLSKGYVGEWQGELQLSAGKFGTLEVVGKAENQQKTEESAEKTEEKEMAPEEPEEDLDVEEEHF